MSLLSPKQLLQIQKENKEKTKISFKALFEDCTKKILSSNIHGNTHIVYIIPGYLVDFPLYDMLQARTYVIKKLNKKGFKVSVYSENKILIDWNSHL